MRLLHRFDKMRTETCAPLARSPLCDRRWRRSGVLAVALLVAAVSAACASGSSDDDDSDTLAQVAPGDRYAPEVEEGLGVSVAILVDNSGSMEDEAEGDQRPKYIVAREAIEAMLAATDSVIAKQPDFPINVGVYTFASSAEVLHPIQRYDRDSIRQALNNMEHPDGGTAIGRAMEVARADLYRAGTFRKYILVVTDGENTSGPSPRKVAREIAARSEGAVRMYFVAFDIDAEKFAFVRSVRGEVVGANNGEALQTSLKEIYEGKILAESIDAGETLPDRTVLDSTVVPRRDNTRGTDTSKQRIP
jgi:Mg-chelatase subunit ChlD